MRATRKSTMTDKENARLAQELVEGRYAHCLKTRFKIKNREQ